MHLKTDDIFTDERKGFLLFLLKSEESSHLLQSKKKNPNKYTYITYSILKRTL